MYQIQNITSDSFTLSTILDFKINLKKKERKHDIIRGRMNNFINFISITNEIITTFRNFRLISYIYIYILVINDN